MDSDFDLALTLFIRFMTLNRGLLEDFMSYWQVMAIYQNHYVDCLRSVLACIKLLEMHCTVFMTEENALFINNNFKALCYYY